MSLVRKWVISFAIMMFQKFHEVIFVKIYFCYNKFSWKISVEIILNQILRNWNFKIIFSITVELCGGPQNGGAPADAVIALPSNSPWVTEGCVVLNDVIIWNLCLKNIKILCWTDWLWTRKNYDSSKHEDHSPEHIASHPRNPVSSTTSLRETQNSHIYEALVEYWWQGQPDVGGERPVTAQVRCHEIPNGLLCDLPNF